MDTGDQHNTLTGLADATSEALGHPSRLHADDTVVAAEEHADLEDTVALLRKVAELQGRITGHPCHDLPTGELVALVDTHLRAAADAARRLQAAGELDGPRLSRAVGTIATARRTWETEFVAHHV